MSGAAPPLWRKRVLRVPLVLTQRGGVVGQGDRPRRDGAPPVSFSRQHGAPCREATTRLGSKQDQIWIYMNTVDGYSFWERSHGHARCKLTGTPRHHNSYRPETFCNCVHKIWEPCGPTMWFSPHMRARPASTAPHTRTRKAESTPPRPFPFRAEVTRKRPPGKGVTVFLQSEVSTPTDPRQGRISTPIRPRSDPVSPKNRSCRANRWSPRPHPAPTPHRSRTRSAKNE